MYEYGNNRFLDLVRYYKILKMYKRTKVKNFKKEVDFENNKIYLQHDCGQAEIYLYKDNK